MGSWGFGTLDNDTAQDFFAIIGDLEQSLDDWTEEMGAMMLWGGVDEVFCSETSFIQSILAACEAIAAALGSPNIDLQEGYVQYAQKIKPYIKYEHLNRALELLDDILNDKIAVDHWEENEIQEWYKNINDLKRRLSQPTIAPD